MLDSQLAKFRAPGTKILTTVTEQIPVLAAPSGARLLVVNLRQGPVNRPILVQNWTEFKKIFGNISIAEERKGESGRRSAYYMLAVSPIYVLNLRSFDDSVDKSGMVELSIDSSVKNAVEKNVPYSKLFNKQQFWQIDPRQMIEPTNTDKLLMFGNVGSSNLSIFVRKSSSVRTSLTFDKWYKNLGRETPAFVYPEDKVADWFLDVFVFDNSFDVNSNTNASYGQLFNSDGGLKKTVINELGQKVDALSQLAALPESGYISTITGSLIPGFINETGVNQDLISLINANVESLGLIAKVNDAIFDNAEIWTAGEDVASNGKKQLIPVDLLGHRLFDISANKALNVTAYSAKTQVKTASYKFPLVVQTIAQTGAETYGNTGNIFANRNDDTTLIKLDNAISPGALTISGADHTYAKTSSNQLYVFEKTKVGVGEKFVSADGNLATSLKSEYIGKLSQIANYGKMLAPVQPYGLDATIAGSNDWDDAAGNAAGFTYAESGKAFPKDGTNSFFVYPDTHPLAGLPLVFRAWHV